MKMLPIAGMLLICSLFCACKKEINNPEKKTATQQHRLENYGFYPKEKGERVAVTNGKDTLRLIKKKGMYVWCGDIVFTEEDIQKFIDTNSNARTTTFSHAAIWPNKTVYYTIASSFPQNELDEINTAIAHFDSQTDLTFVLRTNQPNYISIQRGPLNSSNYSNSIGMKGGMQIINLEQTQFDYGTVIHELGHAVGLHHEQQRSDRDQFITVFFNNIDPDNWDQFQTWQQMGISGTEIGTFDFNSVMLYSSFSGFCLNPALPVMLDINGMDIWGQRFGLSTGDKQAISFLYTPIYAGLTHVYTLDYFDPSSGSYAQEWDSYLNFYSDAAMTTPYTLPWNMRVKFGYSYSGTSQPSINTDIIVNVPAGTSSNYFIGHNTDAINYDMGNIYNFRREVYFLIRAAGYTY